jgi:hypothetical protein
MIFITLGGIGSGKTLFNTFFTFSRNDEGYDVYCNYTLYGIEYYPLNALTDFDEIEGEKTLVNMDEIWITGDSRQSQKNIEFTRYMLQSRKFSKNSDVICSAQAFSQIDVRVRNICHVLFEPEIIATDETTGKPLLLKVDFFNYEKKKYMQPLYIPTVFEFEKTGVMDLCECYDTAEYVEKMNTNPITKYIPVIKYFLDELPEATNKDIVTMLMNPQKDSLWAHDDKMVITRAKSIADYIKMIQKGLVPMPE